MAAEEEIADERVGDGMNRRFCLLPRSLRRRSLLREDRRRRASPVKYGRVWRNANLLRRTVARQERVHTEEQPYKPDRQRDPGEPASPPRRREKVHCSIITRLEPGSNTEPVLVRA